MLIDIKNEVKNAKRLKQIEDYMFNQAFDFNVIDSYYDSAVKMLNRDAQMFIQKNIIYNFNFEINVDIIKADYENFKNAINKCINVESNKRNTVQIRELSIKFKMNQVLNAAAVLMMYYGNFDQAFNYFDLNHKLNDDVISKSFLDKKDEINESIFRYNMALDLISLESYDDSLFILSDLYNRNWRAEKGDIFLILLYYNKKDYLNAKKVLSSIQSLCKSSMFYYEIHGELTKANKNKMMIVSALAIVVALGTFNTYRFYGNRSNEQIKMNDKPKTQNSVQAQPENKSSSDKEIKETVKSQNQGQPKVLKDYTEILNALEKHIKEDNLTAFEKTNNGVVYEELNDRDKKRYEQLYSLYKVKVQLYFYNKGREYFKKKSYEESTKHFTSAYNNNNGEYLDEHVVFMLGQSLQNMKDKRAIKYYEEYIGNYKTGPYIAETLYNTALLYFTDKNIEKAKNYARQLAENHKDSIYYNKKIKDILQSQN